MEKLLKQYKKLNRVLSLEEDKKRLYDYVYYTNKLEGNKLTSAQTVQLLSSDSITGKDIKPRDILEQKGMYRALVLMLKAVSENQVLSLELIKELHAAVLGTMWKSGDSYLDAKSKGQTINSFKVSNNTIVITKGGNFIKEIIPLSNPDNVEQKMIELINKVNLSNKPIIEKAAFLAQEIWLHQPFVDGNKRIGRLLVNFLTMKEGYPLFSFNDSVDNYNGLLVEQVIENKPGLIQDYISSALKKQMKKEIRITNNIEANKGLGFRMVL